MEKKRIEKMSDLIFVCEMCGKIHYENKKPKECECGYNTFSEEFEENE
jgi:rubrerythrin